MLAVYVVLVTIGVVLTVPALFRAIDGLDGNTIGDGVGSTALFAGLAGLFARQVGATTVVAVIVAVAVGLAVGVMSPEFTARLRERKQVADAPARAVE